MKAALTAALAALMVLAADGAKSGDPSIAANTPAAASSGPDVQISLSDMPLQRRGRWKRVDYTTMSFLLSDHENVDFICLAGKTPPVREFRACTKIIKRTALGAYTVDSSCTFDASNKSTSSLVITGDFQKHLSFDRTVMSNNQRTPSQLHYEETWVGSRCRQSDVGWPGL